jgi:hypothetical protein
VPTPCTHAAQSPDADMTRSMLSLRSNMVSSSRTISGPKVGRSRCWLGYVLVCGCVRWRAVVLLYFRAVRRCPLGVLNRRLGRSQPPAIGDRY